MSANDTSAQAGTVDPNATAASAVNEVAATSAAPVRPELTDDSKKWLDHIFDTNGPIAILQYYKDNTMNLAKDALDAGDRKKVQFLMNVGDVFEAASSRITKLEERKNRVRKGKKGAAADALDPDDDDDDED